MRAEESAGASPNPIPAARATARVNSITPPSGRKSYSIGIGPGIGSPEMMRVIP